MQPISQVAVVADMRSADTDAVAPTTNSASADRAEDGEVVLEGGSPGFYAFLEAIGDPKHPDHDDRIDWYGDAFDPDSFDTARINKDQRCLRHANLICAFWWYRGLLLGCSISGERARHGTRDRGRIAG